MKYRLEYRSPVDGVWECLATHDTREEAQAAWDEYVADYPGDFDNVRIRPVHEKEGLDNEH